ncbi:F5/8 type C domain-containing protein [Micromonospora phaseoli]|uniref:F5/8 type C domain-containing protein n=1 Tax=Micromonospora phaseoli TaxID=1144548 RepID=A0A1H7B956_9ACTN|nr:discoidin domain-containing protein [Micromonospora phaseoli]PZV96131.1 F5/8 type C domain-containing protein [Micromonospora phaseoli]GIJ79405.1 glycosyl hydrolase [Micromonospora phaseoli]SEJ69935.1 F5/8 type C domain-containing protein [Micromonospora phaseoli]
MSRFRTRLTAVLAVVGLALTAAPAPPAVAAGGPNLAAGRTATASSTNGSYAAGNVTDGNAGTYWESSGALPQWVQVDLGSGQSIDQVKLKLPAGWEARTQTLSVQGSTNGTSFSTIVGSAGRAFSPPGNAVTLDFPATTTRYVRIAITANTGWPAAQLSELEVYGAASSSTNLAAGRSMSASGQSDVYGPGNANDGNQGSYWESANNAFPQWIQVDLGATVTVERLVLKLPGGWGARTQTLTVQGSTNGSTFSTLVASAGYAFNPTANNTVTVTVGSAATRHVRLLITANTAWPAGQLAELEVYGAASGDTQAPTAPTSLAFTEPGSGQIRLTWSASTDNVAVTGYEVYANGSLRASVSGTTSTYTDTQPASATVSYFVRARDAAGNASGNSNTVTRVGSTPGGTNLAAGKPATASSMVHVFAAANAVDDDVSTYWEGAPGAYPSTLTVALGANASISAIVVKLNPDPAWGPRTQTISVLGREQSGSGFSTLVGSANYSFSPAGSNTVTIPVSATSADVRLQFTANTGSTNGQVAELQVIGTPAPNPDLTVTNVTFAPTAPVETDQITLSATVRNAGTQGSGATTVDFALDGTKVGQAAVGALAAGASSTVSATISARDAGSYQLSAVVDPANTIIEQDESNNGRTSASALVVSPVASSDLVASAVTWSPGTPSAGATVNFSVTLRNQGAIASAGGEHGVTLTVLNDSGTAVRTLTGSYTGTIGAGATVGPVNLGTWTAANGRYTVRVVLAADANELPVKRANNTSERPLFVGRGANLSYDMYEAEEGSVGGGAQVVGPNRTIGDLAGEASGRRAVTLNTTGAYVEWTTKAPANALVTRFSIPDAPNGGGINSTLNVYVNGVLHKPISLTSKHIWLYGAEASPSDSPSAGPPRHLYDEANVLLNSTIPAGSRIRLQKDPANTTTYAIDFINLEQVTPRENPDPARYRVPNGFSHADVQSALDAVRMDTTGNLVGVYLPAGSYETAQKFQVYGKAVKVVGAGMWFTRFSTPASQQNTDAGFRVEPSASGSSFEHLAFFGNYTVRQDGPGKVWGELKDVDNLTLDNVWVEHTVCAYWGVSVSGLKITNSRFRNTFADAVNLTNGSTNNLVSNSEGRSNGDDAFALFSATDQGASTGNHGNVFENLTATLTWRAAGVAVYGGYDNVFRNLYIADMLTYSGITISSLDFGYPFIGFGASPPTRFENISLIRAGGHFWGAQTFPAIWVFSASKEFRGIRVTDVDIVDPTYSGIMFQTKYTGAQPENPITDTVFTNVSISGAQRSGDAFDAKSGFGIWANELPEPGQGPAVGSVTFNNLRLSNNWQDIRNTTSTFTITRN